MKKLLFILLIFFSFQLTAQNGYWLCKNYRVIDSTQGWRTGEVGLIIDFTNSKLMHLLNDTVVDVRINRVKKTISIKNEIDTINYSVKKSSIEFKDDNVISVFHQFEFKEVLNFSKEKLILFLTTNHLILERDSVSFRFEKRRKTSSSEFKTLNYFWKGKQYKGSWHIEKIKGNIFIGMTDDEDWGKEMNIYRVISSNEESIDLEIIKDYLGRKGNIRLMIKK